MQRISTDLASGLKIQSLVGGEKSLPPLVLLHGYPATAYLWRNCIPELSKYFHVLAPDLPGHGNSDKPINAAYDGEYFLQFLTDYFEALDIGKAHLVTHDLGGMIGLKYASHHGNKIDKFVVMDTLPYTDLPEGMKGFYNAVRSPIMSKILRFKPVFSKSFFRDKRIVYNLNKISKNTITMYHDSWTNNSASKRAFSNVLKAPVETFTEPKDHLKNITMATLILWAENDLAMPVAIAKQLANDIPNAQLVLIPECGHFVPEEQPELVVQHVLDFLRSG